MTEPVSIARELVRIGSANPMGRGLSGQDVGEARVTDWLEGFLGRIGVPCRRQAVEPGRDNLVAQLLFPGSSRTVLLEAHQDTVPADGMTIPPFAAEVRDGRLWGRGACDVKGGIAAILAALQRLASERPRGAASVVAAFTVDEESTFAGVRRLVRDLRGVDFAVVAEPTRMEVVIAHKGLVRWKAWTRGRGCHSSRPSDGVNAIYGMARVLEALEQYAAGPVGRNRHPLLGEGTLSVGVIRGGTSVNTVPDSCEVEIDRRLLPGESPADAVEDCRRFLAGRLGEAFSFDPPWVSDPPLDTPPDSEVVRVAEAAVRRVTGGCRLRGVPYGTDASKLAEAGVPAVVLGPGDIAQAHTADEWIEVEEIERAAAVYYELIRAAGEVPSGPTPADGPPRRP